MLANRARPVIATMPGFGSPALDEQRVFRALLSALARPGTRHPVPVAPAPLTPLGGATLAVCLTLLDHETPLWLDDPAPAVVEYLRFHTGVPVVDRPDRALFAVISDPGSAAGGPDCLAALPHGTPDRPELGATVVVQVGGFAADLPVRHLSGPGIADVIPLSVTGLPEGWLDALVATRRPPCGVDGFLVDATEVVGLPRTTQITGDVGAG